MWCSACQQDVPALGSAAGGDLRCGKCRGELAQRADRRQPVAEAAESRFDPPRSAIHQGLTEDRPAVPSVLRCPPLPEEDWALEAELRGVQRLVSSLKTRGLSESPSVANLDHKPAMQKIDVPEPADETACPRRTSAAWAVLSVALAIFACGAVLLGWSVIGQREDLWPLGLPLTLVGQAGLVLGLVLQLDGLTGRGVNGSRQGRSLRRGKKRRATQARATFGT
jgi:hypothetical protein